MKDYELIDLVADLWVKHGGDGEGFDWCYLKIKEAIAIKGGEK